MKSRLLLAFCLCCATHLRAADTNAPAAPAANAVIAPYILTPPAPATPRINGPDVFGVRPGSPFLYTIPTVAKRPMSFSVENLPNGLAVDPTSGQITGSLATNGEYSVVLRAKNALGSDAKGFRIVAGEKIALTPAMGWNSYNCWAGSVDEQKVLRSARTMVTSGLINHGWTYINIDDSW
jgi:alpha-galactosidase